MTWTARKVAFALLAVSLLLLGARQAPAQTIIVSPPAVSYYYPAPTVTYYSPPVVSYYYGAPVSYYTPPVSYYYAPTVSYYAAPAAVTTTRYGLFGRPRVTTTYYPPVYVGR